MVVLVTGASGYLGRAVVSALTSAGHRVRALVHTTPTECAETVTGDLLAPDSLSSAVAGVDAVIHLAGLIQVRESFADPLRYYQVNLTGTVNLLERLPAGTRFVLASTASVYGAPAAQPITEECPLDPRNPYAATKAAAESAARLADVRATTLRLFNLSGAANGFADPDRTRILPRAVAVAAGELSHVDINGTGSAVRDFVHVADAAAAFVAALESDCPGVYNVGSVAASVSDVIATVRRVTGAEVPLVHHPPHPGEAPDVRADTTRIRTALGWHPEHTTLDPLVRSQWEAIQP